MTCQICRGSLVARLRNASILIVLTTGVVLAAPVPTEANLSVWAPAARVASSSGLSVLDVNRHDSVNLRAAGCWAELQPRLKNEGEAAKDPTCTRHFDGGILQPTAPGTFRALLSDNPSIGQTLVSAGGSSESSSGSELTGGAAQPQLPITGNQIVWGQFQARASELSEEE